MSAVMKSIEKAADAGKTLPLSPGQWAIGERRTARNRVPRIEVCPGL